MRDKESTAFLEDGNLFQELCWLAVTIWDRFDNEYEAFRSARCQQCREGTGRLFPSTISYIKAKVRQQLQILRDRGWLSFLGNGRYAINPHQGGFVS
ncbi:hypothetical protein [Propionivibrio sp.]|uniref:hypothetical protein n=1 Tax=Propionivibrio sp. TaxID=2212460 RepID=UPI00345B94CD|nr:hypothetical protein [Propionivibrio sp.]